MSLESVAAETETFVGLLDLDLSLANNVSTVQPELIEQVSHRILSALGPGQNVSVNRVHVRLTARRTDPNLSSSFELRPVRSGATLTLPGTSQVNGSTGGGVLVIEYETDQLFRQNQSIPGASAVATNVVSIIVEGANRTVNGFLGGARANLAFAHGAVGAWQSASCAWWHIADASWTHDVRVASRSASMVNCSTDHLTSFAVLMDVGESGSTVSADHATALSLITFIGVGVSIVCLVLVLAAYAIVKEARTPAKLILMNLSLSLLATLVLFLIVASVDTTDSTNANSEVSSTTCRAIGVSLHYFLLATFGWMLVEGRQLYNQFANVFKDRRSHFSLTAKAAVVYITPAVYITIINILWKDAYRTDGLCWLDNSNNALWLFVGPALGIVLINVIMLTKIIRVVYGVKRSTDGKAFRGGRIFDVRSAKMALKAALVFSCVMGATWVLGLLSLVDGAQLGYQYSFAIVNGLLGVWIFVFHAWRDPVLREHMCGVGTRRLTSRLSVKNKKGSVIRRGDLRTATMKYDPDAKGEVKSTPAKEEEEEEEDEEIDLGFLDDNDDHPPAAELRDLGVSAEDCQSEGYTVNELKDLCFAPGSKGKGAGGDKAGWTFYKGRAVIAEAKFGHIIDVHPGFPADIKIKYYGGRTNTVHHDGWYSTDMVNWGNCRLLVWEDVGKAEHANKLAEQREVDRRGSGQLITKHRNASVKESASAFTKHTSEKMAAPKQSKRRQSSLFSRRSTADEHSCDSSDDEEMASKQSSRRRSSLFSRNKQTKRDKQMAELRAIEVAADSSSTDEETEFGFGGL